MKRRLVDGNKDLVRDPYSNAIINVNKMEYENYISRRKARNDDNQKISSVEQEVASLKEDINEIKTLLKELMNGLK